MNQINNSTEKAQNTTGVAPCSFDPLSPDWDRLQRTFVWLSQVNPISKRLFYLERSVKGHGLTQSGFRAVYRAWQLEQAEQTMNLAQGGDQ
ncbi:MAG: hypothetical protein AAFY20_10565 [Cyanobacteria bacterium J06639_14]